jgi:hypothetical protein
MNMQDIIDTAIENIEEEYGITFERPIIWSYNYDNTQSTIEGLLYNFKALEWIDTSNTDNDDGIIITIGMKNVEYKVEDLKYEIWLLLEQTKYQMEDYKIIPKYIEDICLLEITHK